MRRFVFVFANAESTIDKEDFSTQPACLIEAATLVEALVQLAVLNPLDGSTDAADYQQDVDDGNIAVYVV